MKIFLTSAYPYSATGNFGPEWLREHSDTEGMRLLTDDPAAADCILFVENHPGHDPYFFEVLRSPLYKRFKNKCVLYHDADQTVSSLPTLSPSVEKWQLGSGSKRSVHYVARLCENTTVDAATPDWSTERPHLCSFVGSSRTHQIRTRLLQVPLRNAYLFDTKEQRGWEMSAEQKLRYEEDYLKIALGSHFILCPRGIGPATYRLFESMQLGRAPVIISDEWIEIDGVDWQNFSIRVPEADISRLDEILGARIQDSVRMGKAARQAWEQHFSPAASLRTLAVAALSVLQRPYTAADWLADKSQFLVTPHLRGLLRHYKNRYRTLLSR